MRKICVLIILLILFSASNFEAQTKRKTKSKKPVATKSKAKIRKNKSTKIVSLGVINGRAINLVKPEFPAAAKAVKVRGTVTVSILVDENGNVVEAKAVSGHILLQANSVSAALKSTFTPVKIGGNPVKVQGVIVYNYGFDTFNWLEIGNDFGNDSFTKKLPANFEEEKQLYEQFSSADRETGLQLYQTVKASIEGKLSGDKKSLWLFRLGIFLKNFRTGNQNGDERKSDVAELKNLLADLPENVSPMLISNLKNLLDLTENPDANDSVYEDKTYKQLHHILANLPMFGD